MEGGGSFLYTHARHATKKATFRACACMCMLCHVIKRNLTPPADKLAYIQSITSQELGHVTLFARVLGLVDSSRA